MEKLNLDEVRQYVENHIGEFHRKRLDRLESLRLSDVLKRKNPYLFRAKNLLTAQDLIQTILDAHLSSQEETIFGDFLEGVAIFINKKVYGGWKSAADGIDLEFDKDRNRYIVSIKSGPHWGNKSQIDKLKTDFTRAKKAIRTSNSKINVIAINGCCYGRNRQEDKGEYFKYCGQRFWQFISGDSNLYVHIIEPLGHKAKEKTEEFNQQYAQILNKFTELFLYHFCDEGKISWDALVEYNSSIDSPQKKLTAVPSLQ